jgi:hypothetical protein
VRRNVSGSQFLKKDDEFYCLLLCKMCSDYLILVRSIHEFMIATVYEYCSFIAMMMGDARCNSKKLYEILDWKKRL